MKIGKCPECNLPCSDLEPEDPMPDKGCFRLRGKAGGYPAGYCAANDVSWFIGRGLRRENGPTIEKLFRDDDVP